MSIDLFLRFKASSFLKCIAALSIVAAIVLVFVPGSSYVVGFSIAVHLLIVTALSWFIVKVVWPVRGKLDELIKAVEEHQPDGAPRIHIQPETGVDAMAMGNYKSVLTKTIMILEDQHENLTAHARQLENFSRVLEKQNSKISESRQRYRTILDALGDGLYLIDDRYIIQTINRAEAAFSNATPKEIVGRHCYEVFRQRKHPCSDCMPREAMADGQVHSRLRVEKRRIGREVVNIFCYPILHAGETNSREAVIYIQDTSKLAMMEDQVIKTEKMASIGQMAAGIAHDLNNYLAGIYGVVQLLQMRFEASPEDRDKDMALIGRLRDQVEALNLMAGNLMVFSHPERKEMFPLLLNQVIEAALSFSRYELERDQVVLECDFKDDLPLTHMEKGQIQQVVLNLMLNGTQAIRERLAAAGDADVISGRIVVTTGVENDDFVYFSVSDNGIGINPECAEHLFDPFFSTKEVKVDGGATGLGLFTARTIIEQHQGEITFSSTPGRGSCFKVVLPLKQGAEPCL